MTDPNRPAAFDHDRPGPVGTDHDRPPPNDRLRLVPLGEAARLSGLSAEAIRLRIRRSTLPSTKANDGRLLVRVADLGELTPGRSTATDHDQPTPTDRATLDASRLIERLDALEIERETIRKLLLAVRETHAAEMLAQAERHGRELAEVRERAAKAEAEGQAAGRERQAAEAARGRAEHRQDAAEDELRDLRRPLWERVVRAIRQPR
jgi:hypothetical protein